MADSFPSDRVESVAKTSVTIGPVASFCLGMNEPSNSIASMPSPNAAEGASYSANHPNGPEFVPLSFAQQRLWFLEQLGPNTFLYQIPTPVKISRKLDLSALNQVLNAIIDRHEVLRTRIVCHDGVPAQMISPSEKIALQYVDWSSNS